jgi:hypothetical protein
MRCGKTIPADCTCFEPENVCTIFDRNTNAELRIKRRQNDYWQSQTETLNNTKAGAKENGADASLETV